MPAEYSPLNKRLKQRTCSINWRSRIGNKTIKKSENKILNELKKKEKLEIHLLYFSNLLFKILYEIKIFHLITIRCAKQFINSRVATHTTHTQLSTVSGAVKTLHSSFKQLILLIACSA